MLKNKTPLLFVPSEHMEHVDEKTIRFLVFDRDMPRGPVKITTKINKKPHIFYGEVVRRPYPTLDGICYDHFLERK
jgi:hypothetical protein